MKAILLFTAAVFFAAAPFATDGFGGFDPNRYPIPQIDPPVQPAGYAFAIWGPIYLALLAMAAASLFSHADDADWDGPRWGMILSLGPGSAWIAIAQRDPVSATVLIWVMLAGALWALWRLPFRGPRLLLSPIALYAGWLTAASFVSVGLLGAGYGLLTGETGWAWIAVIAATLVVVSVLTLRPDLPEYGAAAAWAFVAVAVQNMGGDTGLMLGALAAALVVGGMAARNTTQLLR